MRTWDYDITTLKNDGVAQRWLLERKILYGLNGTKLNATLIAQTSAVPQYPRGSKGGNSYLPKDQGGGSSGVHPKE
jgi:hypothetical protein